jgi:hypothetical protein
MTRYPFHLSIVAAIFTFVALAFVPVSTASASQASSPEQVQRITGRIESGLNDAYRVPDLRAGDTLHIYLRATSGNLDPAIGVMDGSGDLPALQAQYQAELERLIAEDANIALELDALRDRFFLAWDDDGGEGYAAALAYPIPADGDYRVLAGGALAAFGRATFGDYELLVGINSPGVLQGEGQPVGPAFVTHEGSTLGIDQSVQEYAGTISAEAPEAIVRLADIRPGATLQVFAERASGDLLPVAILRDHGDKPLEAGNLDGQASTAALSYTLSEGGVGYSLRIIGAPGPDGQPTTGDFRLLVGHNAPDVTTGTAAPTGNSLIKTPIEVQVGVKIDRISEVDSQGEDFTVLGSIRMDWVDPALAFSPDTCNCAVKVYTEKEFDRFLADVQSQWPDFSFFNQQGNRWSQNRAVAIQPDGSTLYYERFTTTFQSDFDFSRFPFDTQPFPIYVDMVYPANRYTLAALPGYNEISSDHGEDEFIISEPTTEVSHLATGNTGLPTSRFTFQFDAPRHLNYYTLQIFIPILLIILISWFTFFMRDYTQRAQAAAANVLLFIAFSFSLTDNYPRLGYLTFLDVIMGITFAINTLVVLYNVYMKRLESRGQGERAERIDHKMDWAYPLAYVVLFGIAALLFLGPV